MTDVAKNLEELRSRIACAAEQAGKKESDITLVNVSKTVAAEKVKLAYDAGERDFGENRVQEYLEKREHMPENIRWHIIGRLQTNKVKYIINNVYLLHSLDRLKLAEALQSELEKKDSRMDVLLQVNTAEEDTKAGFLPHEIMRAAEDISKMDRIRIRGLMTVAPFTDDEAVLGMVFSQTRELYEKLGDIGYPNFDFKWLSMGMSGDFELAIASGANMIRVGSSIFGGRIYK